MATFSNALSNTKLSEQAPRPMSDTDEKGDKSSDSFVNIDIENSLAHAHANAPIKRPNRLWRIWSYKSHPYLVYLIFSLVLATAIMVGTLATVLLTHKTPTVKLSPHAAGTVKGIPIIPRKLLPSAPAPGLHWPYQHDHVARDFAFRPEVARPAYKSKDTYTVPLPTNTPGLHGMKPGQEFDREALNEFAHRPYVGGNVRRQYKDCMSSMPTPTPTPTPVVALERRHDVHNVTANGTVALTKSTSSAVDVDVHAQAAVDNRPTGGPNGAMITGIVLGVGGLIFVAVLFCMCMGRR